MKIKAFEISIVSQRIWSAGVFACRALSSVKSLYPCKSQRFILEIAPLAAKLVRQATARTERNCDGSSQERLAKPASARRW